MNQVRVFLELMLAVACVGLAGIINPGYCVLAYLVGSRVIEVRWGKV